jgi:MFS family permease
LRRDFVCRRQAIGTWSGFTAITAAIGPVLGGWLVQHASWHWVFFINVPIAVIVLGLTLWKVPESRNAESRRVLDWPGALLATVGLGAVTFALIEAPKRAAAGAVGFAGVCALAGFFVVEARSPSPMVSLKLFRSRDFSGANLLTFFLYAALSGIFFFFPMNLIQVQHYTATQAGGALLPLILIIFVLSRWSGGLIAHYGARTPLVIGSLIAGAGYVLLLIPETGGGYWKTIFPGVAVLGVGMAVCIAPLTTAVMSAVSQGQAGVASGVNNAVSRIAGLLAVAVFGLVLYANFNRALDRRLESLALPATELKQVNEQRPRMAAMESDDARVTRDVAESFTAGYRTILEVAVALALASALVAGFLIDPQHKS